MQQKIKKDNLAIIFSAKYEQQRVYKVLKNYADYFIKRYSHLELITINDGSCDRTSDRTLSWMKKAQNEINGRQTKKTLIPENVYVGPYAHLYRGNIYEGYPLTIVDLKEGTQKVGAISLGFQLAQDESIAGFVDTDGFLNPEEYDKLIVPVLRGEVDCALGSRFMDGSHETNPEEDYNCFATSFKITNFFSRILYKLPYNDVECGAKVLSSRAKKKWINEQVCTNLFFDAEMLSLVHKATYGIKEIPLRWRIIDTIKIEKGLEPHEVSKLVHLIKHTKLMVGCLLETKRKKAK